MLRAEPSFFVWSTTATAITRVTLRTQKERSYDLSSWKGLRQEEWLFTLLDLEFFQRCKFPRPCLVYQVRVASYIIMDRFIRWQESWLALVLYWFKSVRLLYFKSVFQQNWGEKETIFFYFSVSKSAYLKNLLTCKVRLLWRDPSQK